MFKRLMIGLVAVGVVAIFIAETANATVSRRRRSVGVYFEYTIETGPSHDGHYFTTGVYGPPAQEGTDCSTGCGQVWGELYCAPPPIEGDTTGANITACEAATGGSAALVAVLDPDALPDFFTPDDYNFGVKAFGQRLELSYFVANEGDTISLPAGNKKNDAGFFFIADPEFSLRDFVGTVVGWDADLEKFIPTDGYGINGEQFLQDVPLEGKYGDGLGIIDGKLICAVWRHDQVKWQGDSLKGNQYGLAAFYATYNAVDKTVEARIMDVYDVCGGLLYNDVEAGVADADQNTYECGVVEEVVFAPAPYEEGGITLEEDAFREKVGTITCNDTAYPYSCRGSAEVELNPTYGQNLCDKHYDDSTYVDFIPIDNECGTYAFTGYARYYGNCEPGAPGCNPLSNSFVNDEVICSEDPTGQGDGSIFLQYECLGLETFTPPIEFPTCVGLGQAPWKVGEAISCPD